MVRKCARLAAVLGLIAAMTIGLADLFARRVIQASSVFVAATSMQLFAGLVVLVFAIGAGSSFDLGGFGFGLLSGLGMGIGIGFYFAGLQRAGATVVSPLVASLTAIVPFGYTLVRGSTASAYSAFGAVVVVLGLVLITGSRSPAAGLKAGLVLGGLSGSGYALAGIAFVEASEVEGWWPAVGQRLAALMLLGMVARLAGKAVRPPAGQWGNAAATGLVTGITSLTYLASLSLNPSVGVVAIATFPAFSVGVGRIFYGDQIQRSQVMGLGLVVAGIALVSVG